MRLYSNDYSGLRSGPILREAGAGGSNPLTPTISFYGWLQGGSWTSARIAPRFTAAPISQLTYPAGCSRQSPVTKPREATILTTT